MFGNDLAHRQGLLSQNAHGELTPGDEGFVHHVRGLATLGGTGTFHPDRLLHSGKIVEQVEANRRATRHRFGDDGETQPFDRLSGGGVHEPVRRVDSGLPEDALGDVLVHGEGASEHAAPGVCDSTEVEKGLERPILPHAPVERRKDDLGRNDLLVLRKPGADGSTGRG